MHDTHGRDGRDEIPGQSAARQQELSEEDTIAQLLIRAWGTRIGCDPPSENCSKQSRLPGLWMMKRVLASDCSLLVFFFRDCLCFLERWRCRKSGGWQFLGSLQLMFDFNFFCQASQSSNQSLERPIGR
jgi:hypothetical protein